jgi:ABC-type protease/lipase transport system fused ATPase/permease subunit
MDFSVLIYVCLPSPPLSGSGYGAVARGCVASPDEIVDVARAASLLDFIQSRDAHFEARVGERGLRLSGGEKQRVGIARAILKRPHIFVFDGAPPIFSHSNLPICFCSLFLSC